MYGQFVQKRFRELNVHFSKLFTRVYSFCINTACKISTQTQILLNNHVTANKLDLFWKVEAVFFRAQSTLYSVSGIPKGTTAKVTGQFFLLHYVTRVR